MEKLDAGVIDDTATPRPITKGARRLWGNEAPIAGTGFAPSVSSVVFSLYHGRNNRPGGPVAVVAGPGCPVANATDPIAATKGREDAVDVSQ